MMNKTIAVGLSGGVDSSVAAYLLANRGYRIIGITMKIWDNSFHLHESAKNACYGPDEEEDIESAAGLCKNLDIPYHVIDLSGEYKSTVLDYFKNEYLAGRTPNPCVRCNRTMKFGFLLDRAKSRGVEFDFFATGHYARVERDDRGRYLLKKGVDPAKDQSYFLAGLSREQLKTVMFPLGEYTKPQVREIARSYGLEAAEKKESQDFIAGGDYAPIFSDTQVKPGNIVDVNNSVLGEHRGIIHYTVGQRRGLGISAKDPVYVVGINAGENKIIVGSKEQLLTNGLIAGDINLLSLDSLKGPLRIKARIRQAHRESDAVLSPEGDKCRVIFDVPQAAVTPGQTVVFYEGDTVAGSGIIEKNFNV